MTDFESRCRVTEETNEWQRKQEDLERRADEFAAARYERRMAEARSNPIALCRWLLKHDEDGLVFLNMLLNGSLATTIGYKTNASDNAEIVSSLKRGYGLACELYAQGEDDE